MRTRDERRGRPERRVRCRWGGSATAALLALSWLAGPALAGPPPPPTHRPPPPPVVVAPPPVVVAPPVVGAPPPLPIAMRVIYAPFYVAGLVVRYGVYYVLVAPFEVLFRTIDYGASGGVDPNRAPGQGP